MKFYIIHVSEKFGIRYATARITWSLDFSKSLSFPTRKKARDYYSDNLIKIDPYFKRKIVADAELTIMKL
jgi:hypothetical protein